MCSILVTFPDQSFNMKKYLLVAVLFFATSTIFAQQKPAYVLYNAEGKKISYKKMTQDVVSLFSTKPYGD